jgi:hypothetical protein
VLDGNGMSYIYFSLSYFGICFSDFNVLKVDHNSHIHYCVCVCVCFYQETEGNNMHTLLILTQLVYVSVEM